MLDLFTEKTFYTKTISLTSNPVFERMILKQLELFKTYMSDKNFYVKNKNPFVALLNNGIPSNVKDLTKEELHYEIKRNAEYLCSTIGFISNRSKGKCFNDEKLSYMVLLDTDDSNLNKKDHDIISVVYTDYCKLDFSYATEDEFMILKINPTELIMDFLEWEKTIAIENNLPGTYNNYIATRLLPKIWDSKINFILFNRFINLYYHIENPKFKNKLPIQIVNLENLIDNDLNRILKLTTINKKLDIRTFLNSFKYLDKKLVDILNFDKHIFTSTSYWMVWLSRIVYIRFFIDLSSTTDSMNTNNDNIKTMIIDIKRFENRNTTFPTMEEDIIFNFYVDYDYIKEKIKYNG